MDFDVSLKEGTAINRALQEAYAADARYGFALEQTHASTWFNVWALVYVIRL